MKRSPGINSRMSSYQYTSAKKAWKWTTGKIVAFSAVGVMSVALIYLESTSDGTATQPAVVENPTLSQLNTPSFDEQYQEFLKGGEKIISQETLDSLEKANTVSVPQQNTPTNTAGTTENSVTNRSVSRASDQPTITSTRGTTAANSSGRAETNTETRVENNLQPVQLSPTSNNRRDAATSNVTGRLEEIDPSEVNQASVPSASPDTEEINEVITEEFYIEEKISGTVSAASDRTPIAGVNISVKGTDIKTVTDSNGKYTITVPGDPLFRTLSYSYQDNRTEKGGSPWNRGSKY